VERIQVLLKTVTNNGHFTLVPRTRHNVTFVGPLPVLLEVIVVIAFQLRVGSVRYVQLGRAISTAAVGIQYGVTHGCTNPGCQVADAAKVRVYTVESNVCGPSVWSLLYVPLETLENLSLISSFIKI
jgi:hypothetical protein